MKTFVLLSLSIAVALGMPFPPELAQNSVLLKEEQEPLLGDLLPMQGHVEVENPASLVAPSPNNQLLEQAKAENAVEREVEMKPEVNNGLEEKTEVNGQQELKAGPEAEVEDNAVVETENEEHPEVSVEPGPEAEVKEEAVVETETEEHPEVKEQLEPEAELEGEALVETEIEEEPVVNVLLEPEAQMEEEAFIEEQPEVNVPLESEAEIGEEALVETEIEEQPEVNVLLEPEAEKEEEALVETEIEEHPEVGVEPESEDEAEVMLEELEEEPEPEIEAQSEVGVQPGPGVEAELEPQPEVNMAQEVQEIPHPEEIPSLDEIQEKFQVQMTLEEENNPQLMDVETPDEESEMLEPIMELEPLSENIPMKEEVSDAELADIEKTLREAFGGEDHVEEHFQNPNMVLDPEITDKSSEDESAIFDQNEFEEGPALDSFGQPMSLSENDFPNEEARMGLSSQLQGEFPTEDESDYTMMMEAGGTFNNEETEMDDQSVLNEEAELDVVSESLPMEEEAESFAVGQAQQDKQEGCCCPGVVLDGKCYQFFREPKRAADAEFFCQARFRDGHLASITSQNIHRQLMAMMSRENGGFTRTWVGGLRFLDTGRFIWLDGSRWNYADWLSGEPNHTSQKEHCVEILPFGNGKFNDFTCWEPQAFICSYTL